jgi:hypothetical protein
VRIAGVERTAGDGSGAVDDRDDEGATPDPPGHVVSDRDHAHHRRRARHDDHRRPGR